MLTALIPAIVIAVILGAIGSLYFGNIQRRRDEADAGIRSLSGMRWREFSHFVLDAMRHRGYDVLTSADEAERGQQTEFLLQRNGERALLSCKHGSAYRLTRQSVSEFGASMKFQGALSGLLITPGTIEPDARRPAESANIELIDGKALWPEIAPLLPQALKDEVQNIAGQRARRSVLISWLGAAVAGIAIAFVVAANLPPPEAKPDVTVLRDVPQAPRPATVAAPKAEAPVGISAPSTVVVAATEEEEDKQRAEVVRMVGTLPGVDRAVWTTKSTLQVFVDETSTQRFDEICTVLMHYANLRTSRVHLQPPENSQQLVRFKQCATM